MSKRVIIVPSQIGDVYRLAAALRSEDRNEVESLGLNPRAALRGNFRGAFLRRTYFVDGEIAAMSGCYTNGLSDIAVPYLLTAGAVERVPIQVLKCGRAAVAEMLRIAPRLEGEVAAAYTGACRLLETMGFTLGAARPLGPREALFRQFWIDRRS